MNSQSWRTETTAIAMVVGMFLSAWVAAQDAEYVGQQKCKMCHNKPTTGEQWNKWKQTKHAEAYKALLTDPAKEYAKKAGLQKPPEESPECLRCHVTAVDAKTGAFHPQLPKEESIQCESCHGPGSKHLEYGKKMLLVKGAPPSDVPTNILKPDEKTCLTCHNNESPAWKPDKYTLEDGSKAGFDFKQALAQVVHLNPEKKHEPAPAATGKK
ncbi:MAG: hypothetical protein HY706_18060 [Candidatus Hydrogenedentes bacterium]|nr:hypothetical protein [Candidatus Hydrogenedentota bacterium]